MKYLIYFFVLTTLSSCEVRLMKEDKIFHAGPTESGLSAIFFELYKNNIYNFCDGDFLDYGCSTGQYKRIGDTIIMAKLRLSRSIPNNKFIIFRYDEQDSTFWKNKYPNRTQDWKGAKNSADLQSATGNVFVLDKSNKPLMDADQDIYFLIRQDDLVK